MPALLLPILGYGLLGAATIGGTWWGYTALRDYQQSGEEQARLAQEAQQAAQRAQQDQMSTLMNMLNPLMIAGTLAMTGLGAFIMVSGIRQQKKLERRKRRELRASYED